MAQCPTCGRASSSIPTAVKWLIGLVVVGCVGLLGTVLAGLVIIAAIGASVQEDEAGYPAEAIAAEATLQEQIESGIFVSDELREHR